MTIKRRPFTKEFKLQVLHEIQAGLSVTQAAGQHHFNPNLIRKWCEQVARYADRAFAGNGHNYTDAAKVAELERLIGVTTSKREICTLMPGARYVVGVDCAIEGSPTPYRACVGGKRTGNVSAAGDSHSSV